MFIISADILCPNFNAFHNPTRFLYILYGCSVTPWRRSIIDRNVFQFWQIVCKKYNFTISAYISVAVWTQHCIALTGLSKTAYNGTTQEHAIIPFWTRFPSKCMHFRFPLDPVAVHPMKTSRGRGGSPPVILNSALDGNVWSASRPGRFIRGKDSSVSIY